MTIPLKHIATFSVVLAAAIPSLAQTNPAENPPQFEPQEKATTRPQSVNGGFRIQSVPSTEWVLHKTEDGAHPSGIEQAMTWLMNRARTNPAKEGLFLASTGNQVVESSIAFFHVDLEVMKAEFAALPPKPPSAFDRRIYIGSEVHSQDLIARNAQDHANQPQRVTDAGFQMNGANFSVFSFAEDPVHAHAGFNIDWGPDGGANDGMQVGRGHRVGLMNDRTFDLTNAGIAFVPETNPLTNVGPLVVSITYAQAWPAAEDHFNKFLVGTVWDDTNQNGLYDDGEGLGGVTVMPDSGTYYAVTGDAGGYAIPVSADGVYTIQFFGGELASPEERVVEVDGVSALVVWNAADSYNPVVEIAGPEAPLYRLTRTATGLTVSWTPEADQSYALESSTMVDSGWQPDSRTITTEDGVSSFEITSEEIAASIYFRLLVTLPAESQ